ncbi:MAG TPA: hypothetical protein DDY20_12625 [Desulfobulbaceae bacterium]|nr:hypothetical protein [Desulfobulbaceae bacterium]
MNQEISKLIDLQGIDSELDGFDQEIKAKEQEIVAREQSIADKETKISLLKVQTEELAQSQRDLKAELEDALARIKDRQNKMMQVQTSREHQALLKEIEENKKLIKANEERTLQIMEQIEEAEKNALELANLCSGEKTLLVEEAENVKKAVSKILARKKSVLDQRMVLIPELNPGTLKRYDMLRQKRNGSAVVPTKNGICQGCFMTIPPQQDNEIRRGEKLNFCPTCQRILFFLAEDAEPADA